MTSSVWFRPAYKTTEQRSRGEYKAINVAVDRPFRLIDFDPDRRLNRYEWRASTARFTRHYRKWGNWFYGKRYKPRFMSKFLIRSAERRSYYLPY